MFRSASLWMSPVSPEFQPSSHLPHYPCGHRKTDTLLLSGYISPEGFHKFPCLASGREPARKQLPHQVHSGISLPWCAHGAALLSNWKAGSRPEARQGNL